EGVDEFVKLGRGVWRIGRVSEVRSPDAVDADVVDHAACVDDEVDSGLSVGVRDAPGVNRSTIKHVLDQVEVINVGLEPGEPVNLQKQGLVILIRTHLVEEEVLTDVHLSVAVDIDPLNLPNILESIAIAVGKFFIQDFKLPAEPSFRALVV